MAAWFASQTRSKRLIARGLEVLGEPEASDLAELTRMLLRFAEQGAEQRRIVGDGIRDALSRGGVSSATAARVQGLIPGLASKLDVGLKTTAMSRVMKRRGSADAPARDWWADFEDEVMTYPILETMKACSGTLPPHSHACATMR